MRRCRLLSALGAFGIALGLQGAPATAAPPCDPPATDLVHYWPGEGTAEDAAGAADGTVSGATFSAGRIGNAFSFDGIDDTVAFGTTTGNFGTSDFTVSYWIRTVNTTELQGVFGKRSLCAHSSFWDNRLNPTGTVNVEVDQDAAATNHNSQATTATVNDGAFHLLAFAREGPEVRIYVDGVLSVSHSTAGTTAISNAANLIAGRSACTGADGTTEFAGLLDEIQIYDRALSACEILVGVDAGLDIDLDGNVGPLTDMLLLLRYFFGFRGATLIAGTVGGDCIRCDAQSIEVYIASIAGELDVDGNGAVAPLTDALLLLRFGFGFRGNTLISAAVDDDDCTRCDAADIEAFLSPYFL